MAPLAPFCRLGSASQDLAVGPRGAWVVDWSGRHDRDLTPKVTACPFGVGWFRDSPQGASFSGQAPTRFPLAASLMRHTVQAETSVLRVTLPGIDLLRA